MSMDGQVENPATYGERLGQARKRAGLTQVQLARRAGVTQGVISHLERGNAHGSAYTHRIAAALGVSAMWLAEGRGSMEPTVPGAMQLPGGGVLVPVLPVTLAELPKIPPEQFVFLASQEHAEVATADRNAFVFRVEDGALAPRFNPGEYALAEPGTSIEIEDDVLVRLTDGTVLFRRLLSRKGGIRLGTLTGAPTVTLREEDVDWMVHVAHALQARRIQRKR